MKNDEDLPGWWFVYEQYKIKDDDSRELVCRFRFRLDYVLIGVATVFFAWLFSYWF